MSTTATIPVVAEDDNGCRKCGRPLSNRFSRALKVGQRCAEGMTDEELRELSRRLWPTQLRFDVERTRR